MIALKTGLCGRKSAQLRAGNYSFPAPSGAESADGGGGLEGGGDLAPIVSLSFRYHQEERRGEGLLFVTL